jgi:hypothetical protein
VWVQGGGIQPGYEAELRFDGNAYPSNPSVIPARPLVNRPHGQIVIAEVTGARAEGASRAVEQSKQASTEAREITYKEAHDLLQAFLKAPGGVEQSGDLGYKEFYFFMATMGHSPIAPGGLYHANLEYYAVDRRTGDVWSAGICKRIATPALKKLQAALRKHIGLTNASYEALRRLGPLCEPGMPRGE